MADHLEEVDQDSNWPDSAYIPCGGKSGIPKIAKALNELGVKVKVVADIDLLNNQGSLRQIVEAVGGNWSDIEQNWKRLDAAVRNGIAPLTTRKIKEKIKALIDASPTDDLPKSDIESALKQNSAWAIVKAHGKSGIPKGDAQKMFSELDSQLRKFGIFVVPVGEVENFYLEIGSHGPKFVTRLLSEIALDHAKLEELRRFISDVFEKWSFPDFSELHVTQHTTPALRRTSPSYSCTSPALSSQLVLARSLRHSWASGISNSSTTAGIGSNGTSSTFGSGRLWRMFRGLAFGLGPKGLSSRLVAIY